MVMPLAGRVVAAVAGGLLVFVAVSSVTVTLIVSRPVKSWLTRWVDQIVDWAYEQVVGRFADARRRDQLRATQAAAVLLGQLAAWLLVAYVGFALLLWPFATRGVVSAFVDAGSSLFTLGFAVPHGAARAVIVFLAAATGLVLTHAADRLPADPVRRVQSPGDRWLCSTRGPGCRRGARNCWRAPTTRWEPGCRPWIRCRICTRRGRPGPPTWPESHHLPGAGPVPLPGTAVVLGDLATGRAGLRRAFPGPVP